MQKEFSQIKQGKTTQQATSLLPLNPPAFPPQNRQNKPTGKTANPLPEPIPSGENLIKKNQYIPCLYHHKKLHVKWNEQLRVTASSCTPSPKQLGEKVKKKSVC